jgi:uncharacterized protein (TIGR01777 family)
MPVSAADLFRWHERSGAFQRLAPPWTNLRVRRMDGIRDGDVAEFDLYPAPVGPGIRWQAVHEAYEPGASFTDVQARGPFASWRHRHTMEPLGEASRLVDAIDYRLPAGPLGNLAAGSAIRAELSRQFAYRHRTTLADLTLHMTYDLSPMRIAITGASGTIGTALTALLQGGGHTVLPITRTQTDDDQAIYWQPRQGVIEAEKLEGVDAVIHLAGENIFALRWTEEKKERILQSRLQGTELLAKTLAGLERPPRVLLSASAIGIYGDTGSRIVTEESPIAETGFLSLVTRQWERATQAAEDAGIRVAHLRTGIVLTPRSGALELMLPAFKLGVGGRLGSPHQWFSWIGLDDAASGYLHALATEELSGPVNLVAPNPVTMEELAATLGRVLRRPTLFNVPGAVARALMGEIADEALLQSTRVVPSRLLETGYAFRTPRLEELLRHVLGRERAPFDDATAGASASAD